MARVAPYHSADPHDGREYHVLDDCPSGLLIPRQLRQIGTGGLPLCDYCARLAPEQAAPHAAPTDQEQILVAQATRICS